MDSKEAERQQKMAKLVGYIGSQLDKGTAPKELAVSLVEKGVPRQTAVDLIKRTLEKRKAVQTPPQTSVPPQASVISQTNAQPNPTSQPMVQVPSGRIKLLSFVRGQYNQGKKQEEILNLLVENGIDRSEAIDLVLSSEEIQQAELEPPVGAASGAGGNSGMGKMGIGLVAIIGGGALTAASYSAAKPGGTYIAFYGLIIYGVFSLISGVIDWSRGN